MSLYELQVMNGNDYYNGLSYNSILYINVMEQMKECTVSKIADALKITKSAVTLKINELVKQGVVIKKQSEKDKRVYYLELSPHMEQVLGIYEMCIRDRYNLMYSNKKPRLLCRGKCRNCLLYTSARG